MKNETTKSAGQHYKDGWRDALEYIYKYTKSWETFQKFKDCHISPHMSEMMMGNAWFHDLMDQYEKTDKSITFEEYCTINLKNIL